MFVDQVQLILKSGKGGSGSVSFRREKYIPRGGPDGGDGGRGGNVYFQTALNCYSLVDYRHKKHLSAGNGKSGSGRNKTGADGEDLWLIVPAGTIIKNADTSDIIVDLSEPGVDYMILPGGLGGLGNNHFKSSTNQTPRFAQPGEPGQSIRVILELKLVASVGLVGFPNSGKSTLISRISNARPKIADYPFTTLVPNLGVVDLHDRSLVVADIPGLIEGAHLGSGMGMTFLKHIERTELLAIVIDPFSSSSILPEDQYTILMNELKLYNPSLLKKKKIVVVNKSDLLPDSDKDNRILKLKNKLDRVGIDLVVISAATGYNILHFIDILFQFCPKKNV